RISGIFVPMFFKDYTWVEEFQLEQKQIDRIDVRLKPAGAYEEEQLRRLAADLQGKLGPSVRLQFEVVPRIPRTPSGKHRAVISHLGEDETAQEVEGAVALC
ncbi:MAG TPA: hypothetical protein VFU47_00155, partial [Armatimonadota bacterium]|nr:hypothetical protein [Armatimonadota bacterium]